MKNLELTFIQREGALGALLDEYERAISNLCQVIQSISLVEYTVIADPDTSDPDCRSIQTVMNHVVKSGYGYARYIQTALNILVDDRALVAAIDIQTPENAIRSLQKMFETNVQYLYNDTERRKLIESQMELTLTVPWKEVYSIDQLLEHAVMHILRHKRQILRLLLRLQKREV